MTRAMLKKVLQAIVRKRQPVTWNDVSRSYPVSTAFGMERGTPIDRYYIDCFIKKQSCCITGAVLEIGDNYYTMMFGKEITSSEVLHEIPDNSKATIIGDLTDVLSLPSERFDCFICTQTFNFIFDLQKAVFGAHRVLKPGGVLLATVAGISQISRHDMNRWGDYWRFTDASVQKLFSPLFAGGINIETFGNVAVATAFLQGLVVEDLKNESILDVNDPNYQLVITLVGRK
jgi:SAM-dependent methyltransferase